MSEKQDKPEPVRTSAVTYVDPNRSEGRFGENIPSIRFSMREGSEKPRIPTELDRLQKSITEARVELERLINEINPVLRPDEHQGDETTTRAPSEEESELASIIRNHQTQVVDLTDLIRHTIDRLEI